MKMIQDIIIKPIISEASIDMMEQANGTKKYVFKVMKNATKPEIAKAVEEMFGVKVLDVNTINMKRKPKRLGVHSGYTANWKKAIVTLKADSKAIEFFEGLN
jgi:large subunit ribosomal protein L23